MKKIGLVLLLVIISLNNVVAEKCYDVYGIDGSAWVLSGSKWQTLSKDDYVCESDTVRINSNTKIEFADSWNVYTIKKQKKGILKDLIAWTKQQTALGNANDVIIYDRLHGVGLVTVREQGGVDNEEVKGKNEIYIIFYDSGRSLTACFMHDDQSKFEKVEITKREEILNLLDECRASNNGLESIYQDVRLYSMLWAEIENYLKDDMTIIYEVPQYLYNVDMEKIKMTDSIEMSKKYKMYSVEPKL